MDAQHRHELKENDLADFLTNFGQWWAKYGAICMTLVLVIVGVFAGKRLFDARSAATKQQAWSDLALSTSPASFRVIAQSDQTPTIRSLAYLRAADLLLARTATPNKNEQTTNNSVQKPYENHTPEQLLAEAALMYEQILQDNQAHTVYKLNALLGLAAVAEGQRDWELAHTYYQKVIEQSGSGFDNLSDRASARLNMLSRLEIPVVFAIDPPAKQPSDDALLMPDSTLAPKSFTVPDTLLPDTNFNLDLDPQIPDDPATPSP